jgi:hypothetical protein
MWQHYDLGQALRRGASDEEIEEILSRDDHPSLLATNRRR